jgi:Raf kinase inhibitor-like YbhB/YbcL family protein
MELYSPVFEAGQPIPVRFTCDGQDLPPPLRWSGVPKQARSLALIVDDPDAPGKTWVHWLVWNLPPTVTELPEGVSVQGLPAGSQQGTNSSGNLGYEGPCPPRGMHRYYFKLYALDAPLRLPARADKQTLLKAMQGHVLAEAELMGTYTRAA